MDTFNGKTFLSENKMDPFNGSTFLHENKNDPLNETTFLQENKMDPLDGTTFLRENEMDPLNQFFEYQIYLNLFRVALPVLLIIGTGGNVTSLIVLMQPKHRSNSILIFLSFSDLLTLWLFNMTTWLPIVFGVRIRSSSDAACKVLVFMTFFQSQLSILYIFALSLNRFICVLIPFKAKLLCTIRNTNIMLAGIMTVSFLVNCHALIGLGVNEQGKCAQIKEIYDTVTVKLWANMQITLFIHVPIIFVIIANISIITKLVYQSKKFTSANSKILKRNTTSKTTKMLVILSFVYLVLVSLVGMFNLKYDGKHLDSGTEHKDAIILLLYALSTTAFLANSSLNCFLYCFLGSKFRKDVQNIFCTK